MTSNIPSAIDQILQYLARWAAAYDSGLKWDEEAKLKSDLMINRSKWMGFAPEEVRVRCLELGMTHEDSTLVAEYVRKAQQGKRLIASRSYRGFTFPAHTVKLVGQENELDNQ